ncbi:SDR family NAD(P)-dependent oxidoreductase [Nocardioides ginsengisoli]|uniref:SDR family NAD(P)-dependent oxidoreductase n=1 Tax=Nocardioides ginsengisoli TaxID=363868 RepID=A0ABW3VV66_9ACTN
MPEVEGGTALVVGGTSGVGLAAAHLLADRGLRAIVLAGRDAERGATAAQQLADRVEVHFVQADAGDADGATVMFAHAVEVLGGIDFAITSTVPSRIELDLIHRTPVHSIGATITGFALPPLHVTRLALEHMGARGGGAIVNVASDAAKVPTPGESIIGAAMAGIVMFSRVAALEGRRNGVRVNAVTPSLIADTPTTDRVLADGFSAKLFASAARAAALGVASARDVAEAAVFLCEARSGRTTGQVISVNGAISIA